MGGIACVLGETVAMLNLFAAYSMWQRRRRLLSLILAGINCIFMPLGTVLGVFMFIVLLRLSVKVQYDEAAGRTHLPTPPWAQ